MMKAKKVHSLGVLGVTLGLVAGEFAFGAEQLERLKGEVKKGIAKAADFDIDLEGDGWTSQCRKIDAFNIGALNLGSVKKTVRFDPDGHYETEEAFYTKVGCKDENLGLKYRIEGTAGRYKRGDSSKSDDLRQVDITVEKESVRVTSETLVKAMNTVGFCNTKNWHVDHETDVTPKKCTYLGKGDHIPEVYQFKAGKLYFGRASLFNATSFTDDRPKEVSSMFEYKKQ